MKTFLPIFLLLLAVVIAAALIVFTPEPAETTPERPIARVEVVEARPETIRPRIRSQGTLLPAVETELSAEVAGRVLSTNPDFNAGGFFQEGDTLLRIDPADYKAERAAREAELADARLELALEKATAEQARADWNSLEDGRDVSPSALTLREPQLARARARVKSARAALEQAERNLARTRITAPYDGRILATSASVGQFVTAAPATPVARIYASKPAEIRLPLSDREASFFNLDSEEKPRVMLFAEHGAAATAGQKSAFTGRLIRFEGSIDPATRMLHAVAELDARLGERPVEDAPRLRHGLFLEAEIHAPARKKIYALPRSALRGAGEVYIRTGSGTLESRKVSVLQSSSDRVLVSDGLEPGEQVVTSPVAYFVEDMPAEIAEDR